MKQIRRHSYQISIPLSISSEKPPSCQPHPVLIKAPNEAPDSNIIKQHKFPQQPQPLQLIIKQYFHIASKHLIFHQVLEKAKSVSTRTSSQTSINSEISDEQSNPTPQIPPQAVSSQCHHITNDHLIPQPTKVVISQPALHQNPLLKKADLRNMMTSPILKSTLTGLNETPTSNDPPINITVRKVPIQAPPSSTLPQVPPAVPPTSGTVESEPQNTA
ncbi:hypothetical protein O181_067371 [Austropuccinia psidii MF-1]|uniref:Uncharacterized protein n=1 Tax=Austropuccinia psidii MF-1 TaxID=1389203 RepID=A0A9Q3ESS5_9BASI|nr:hypothetical protein [Austropuccinia psidii MF-1]